MIKRNNKVCICCGTSYEYCNSCAEYAHLPQWKNIYDKIECKVIFDVATDYKANKITKEEGKEILSKYDLRNIEMRESLQKVTNEILENDIVETISENLEILETEEVLHLVSEERDTENKTEKEMPVIKKQSKSKSVKTKSVIKK